MKHTRQTLILVVAAALLAGVAVATHYATKPTPIQGFEKIGSEFYAGFDPAQASSLRVVSYNADEASISEFEVERKDGLWRIPSHHNYPADAKDQLAKAAASLLGLSREALASRQESDHERFGVISPESDDPSQSTGLGQRISVTDESGKVLADLIIGKEVEDREGYYYIRRPDEKETYYAQLDIDLSTKFAAWIEQDLLKMDRWNVVRLVMSKPDINEEGRIIDRERVELSRKDTAAQWQMAGLDEATEEVDRTAVDNLLRNIDELEIVGVRPKPAQIAPDLRVEIPAEFRNSTTAMLRCGASPSYSSETWPHTALRSVSARATTCACIRARARNWRWVRMKACCITCTSVTCSPERSRRLRSAARAKRPKTVKTAGKRPMAIPPNRSPMQRNRPPGTAQPSRRPATIRRAKSPVGNCTGTCSSGRSSIRR
jgi:hypothetical protein